jgi:long-chain acyl-CoA synthetase
LEAEAHARARGLSYEDFADLTRHPQMVALVREIVERVNSRVSSSEAVKKFLVPDRDFQIEADEVTPTMKVKRNVVTERYGELIHSMYA